MLDGSNFDPRPLRLRIMDALDTEHWMTGKQLAEKLDGPVYTVGAMLGKIFMYGGPIERMKSQGGGAYRYRRKLKKDHHA